MWAALEPALADELAALVLLSPNFHPRNRLSRLLLWPWGEVLARWIEGRERCFPTHSGAHARHWTECHATEALLPMMALVEHVALEAKTPHFKGHSRAVSTLSQTMASCMGLPPKQIRTTKNAGCFHDIGMIAIPDAIINKEDALAG